MVKIVLATKNRGKIDEIKAILECPDAKGDIVMTSLPDYPDIPEIAEDGATFTENARKKALTVARHTGLIAIADD